MPYANMERFICIHAHFYQPPRENPWLEAIEQQDSAYPYHDWNERISAECYGPNAVARILDSRGRIARLLNNYAQISFNVGPTLLSWLETKAPEVYQALRDADGQSREKFSGHGSALAQVYSHVILPLANRRDRYTQVLWGIRDFERRFGRKPEGMWLPETAVDLASLDVLAELGIRFSILAPHQAARTRRIGQLDWQDVSNGSIDTTKPYQQNLPSGRKIALFFYNAAISHAVAFERLLSRGEDFVDRLIRGFSESRNGSQLVHIATDGETYGHHHRFGEMALAYALHTIETQRLATLTNYGEFLERHPPQDEVEIIENTSWSCAHGLERWRGNCGCNSGRDPGWNQEWRTPVRAAFDWLRDSVSVLYEEAGQRLLSDPWQARDDYISVINERTSESVDRFLAQHAVQQSTDTSQPLKLLEMQRHTLLMYASCAWFFDDLSGIETIQGLQYAARAVHLAEELFGGGLEVQFLDRLSRAKSNVAQLGDGRAIYEKFVNPAKVDWHRLGAHYAIASLFYDQELSNYPYAAERREYDTYAAGNTRLATGRLRLTSLITRDSRALGFAVLFLGDHVVTAAARECLDRESYTAIKQELEGPFYNADFPELIRIMDRRFSAPGYSLKALFHDDQRRVVERILSEKVERTEALYGQIYDDYSALMGFLTELQIPLPKALRAAAEVTLNRNLRSALANGPLDRESIQWIIHRAKTEGVTFDVPSLEFAFRRNLESRAWQVAADPANLARLQQLNRAVALLPDLPFAVNLWRVQNVYYRLLETFYPAVERQAAQGDKTAQLWIDAFVSVGNQIGVRIGLVD